MKRIGIVGSRRRSTIQDRKIVSDIIHQAIDKFGPARIEIVSGGCRSGADKFAKDLAEFYGLSYKEFPIPTEPPVRHRGEFTERAYARNKLIAEYSDVLFALAHPDRTGGTENTVSYSLEFGKKVFVVDPRGRFYLPQDAPKPDEA